MEDKTFYFYAVKNELFISDEFENILIDKTILSPDKSCCKFLRLHSGKTNGQYVSIYKCDTLNPKMGYKLYVQKNISFMIEPEKLKIIKPKYIKNAHDILLNKKDGINLFSDIEDEYMVENYIPMDDVYAISFPTKEYLKNYLNNFHLTDVSAEDQLLYIKSILKVLKDTLNKNGYDKLPVFDINTLINIDSEKYDQYVKTLVRTK